MGLTLEDQLRTSLCNTMVALFLCIYSMDLRDVNELVFAGGRCK